MFFRLSTGKKCKKEYSTSQKRKTYEYRIEEQTFKQVCGRFSGFVSQVERICKENTRQPDKWLSGREVCALLGISIRSLQNYRDSGKLGYSQIGNKLYYKSTDIEKLVAECTVNQVSGKKNDYIPTNK